MKNLHSTKVVIVLALPLYITASSVFADEYAGIHLQHETEALNANQNHEEHSEFTSFTSDFNFLLNSLDYRDATIGVISRILDFNDATSAGHSIGLSSDFEAVPCPDCPLNITQNGNLVSVNGTEDTFVFSANNSLYVGGDQDAEYTGETFTLSRAEFTVGIQKATSLVLSDVNGNYGFKIFGKDYSHYNASVEEDYELTTAEVNFDGAGTCTMNLTIDNLWREIPWPNLNAIAPYGEDDPWDAAISCSYSVKPSDSTLTMDLMSDDGEEIQLFFNISNDYQYLTFIGAFDDTNEVEENYFGLMIVGLKRGSGQDNSALSGYYFGTSAIHFLSQAYEAEWVAKQLIHFDPEIAGDGEGFSHCSVVALSGGADGRVMSGQAGNLMTYPFLNDVPLQAPGLQCSYKVSANGTVTLITDNGTFEQFIGSGGDVYFGGGATLTGLDSQPIPEDGAEYQLIDGVAGIGLSIAATVEDMDSAFAAFFPDGAVTIEDMDFDGVPNEYDLSSFDPSTRMFNDVGNGNSFRDFIEALAFHGVTSGCGNNNYCPNSPVTREQMAVFLLRGIHGSSYFPPAINQTRFNDVPMNNPFAAWIEQLAAEGITSGCGNNNYCPKATVTREQMAVFLLRSKYGSAFFPPAIGSSAFNDVPLNNPFAAWIAKLAADGVTSGCAVNLYCPKASVTRAQMAVFLVRTFDLPLYFTPLMAAAAVEQAGPRTREGQTLGVAGTADNTADGAAADIGDWGVSATRYLNDSELTEGLQQPLATLDGEIRHPVASADGARNVFSSEADDLVAGDNDGMDDLFLYEVAGDQLTPFSRIVTRDRSADTESTKTRPNELRGLNDPRPSIDTDTTGVWWVEAG